MTYLEYFLKFDKTNYFQSKSRRDFSSLSKARLITNLVDGFFKWKIFHWWNFLFQILIQTLRTRFSNEKLVWNKFKKSLSVGKLKRQHILRYRTITDIRITFHIMTFDNGIKWKNIILASSRKWRNFLMQSQLMAIQKSVIGLP